MRKIVKLGSTIAISMVLAGGLTACGGMFTPDEPLTESELLQGQEGRILWEAGLQYVKLVGRDSGSLANEHPESLTSEQMRTVLGSLNVIESGLFKVEEVPLFSSSELVILSTAIANGLTQASPNDDVNFVSVGTHKGGLAKERKTTTGRVFISGGRLNIIFGLVHELYRDKDIATGQEIDRRVNPLLPGKRSFDSEPDSRVSLDKGQSFYLDPETGKERSDWVVIDIATVLQAAKERQTGDSGLVSPELLEDVARSKQDASNLRHDVGNMKEIIFEMSEEIETLKKELELLKK